MKNNPKVSVIIPTKNSEEFLDICLKSVKSQTYKDIEMIVVDNNSTDKTKQIARKYTRKVYNIGPERAAQTNYGISKAIGEYIYRIDGDFYLDKTIISKAVELCQNRQLDGVAVHNTSDPSVSFWSRVRRFERDMYRGDDLVVGVRFYTKQSWKKINGYSEDIVLDDYDFHNRFIQEFKWGRITPKEHHLGEPRNLWVIFKKNYYYGKDMVRYLRKYPVRGLKQSHPIRGAYFKHWKSFLNDPILTGGFLLMMLVKYTGGMLGFISAIIKKSE